MSLLGWIRGKGKETEDGKPEAMKRPMFIAPAARDRWLSTALANWTPEAIELTIRGALSGDLVRQWELFDLMEGTWYRLQKNLEQIKADIIAMNWQVQPWARKGHKPTEEAKRKASLIDELIWSMQPRPDQDENDFEDTLRDILDARGKGISVLEIDWDQRPGAFGIRATRQVHPRYYGYPTIGEDRLMLRVSEVHQNNPSAPLGDAQANFAPFPEDKFILAVCKAKSGHPINGALLRCLGFWWAATNFTGPWLLNFCQLFGQPIRWATYDPNMAPTDRLILESMMENMGSAAWALFPSGTQLELKEAMKGGTDNPQIALFDLADKICDIRILGQTLTSDVGDSGSRALGDVHQSVLCDMKTALANWAAKTIRNQLFRPALRLNFGNEDECPFLQHQSLQYENPKDLADRDHLLHNMGLKLPSAWMYERHGVPRPSHAEATLKPITIFAKATESRPFNGKRKSNWRCLKNPNSLGTKTSAE